MKTLLSPCIIKVDDIMAEDYLPREDDILRARKITQGMDQLTFKQTVSFIFLNIYLI